MRRAAIATFAAAVALVVACGHQVSPNPPTSDLAGRVVVKVRLMGPVDLVNDSYAIVIDTCGGGVPYPTAYLATFTSYSYAFFVGSSFGVASPQLYEYFVNPNSNGTITKQYIRADPSLEQLVPDSNPDEFELVFTRAQLSDPAQQGQPCPDLSPVPTGPFPTTSAATPPAATTTATPFPYPTVPSQVNWTFNFFTIQAGVIADSLGMNGSSDVSYPGAVLNTSISDDVPVFKALGGTGTTTNPSLQLSGGEIQNYP